MNTMSFLKCGYCNKKINFQAEETLACRICGQSYHRDCLEMMELDEENECTNVARGNRKPCGTLLTESLFPETMSNLVDLTADVEEDENFDDYEEELLKL
jgi:hypothetical protein